MYKTKEGSFVDLCLQGKAIPDEIDEYVAEWHRQESDLDIVSYLGMTPEEYDLFVKHPDAVPLIVSARREKRPLRDVISENMARARPAD
jgi:hypothetical protein